MSACSERHVTDVVRGTWYACLFNSTFVVTSRSLVNGSYYKPHVSRSDLFSTTTTTTTATTTTNNKVLLLIITMSITTVITNNNVDCRKMTLFIFKNCVISVQTCATPVIIATN
jgi:hypothetical protein